MAPDASGSLEEIDLPGTFPEMRHVSGRRVVHLSVLKTGHLSGPPGGFTLGRAGLAAAASATGGVAGVLCGMRPPMCGSRPGAESAGLIGSIEKCGPAFHCVVLSLRVLANSGTDDEPGYGVPNFREEAFIGLIMLMMMVVTGVLLLGHRCFSINPEKYKMTSCTMLQSCRRVSELSPVLSCSCPRSSGSAVEIGSLASTAKHEGFCLQHQTCIPLHLVPAFEKRPLQVQLSARLRDEGLDLPAGVLCLHVPGPEPSFAFGRGEQHRAQDEPNLRGAPDSESGTTMICLGVLLPEKSCFG